MYGFIRWDTFLPLVQSIKKISDWDNHKHIKKQLLLHHYLLLTYCSKGSFLFFDWTGKLTAVAT